MSDTTTKGENMENVCGIKPIKLLSGSHADTGTTGQGCFMNVIAYLNGESQITDQSPCVCVTIRPIAIWLNDFATDEQRQRLLPFVLRAMGSATDDREVMNKRLTAVVRYAEFNARLAAKYAAHYAAEYAAKYAESAAKYAAKSAAKYAAESAAKYAAESAAKYAAKSAAKYAAESAAKYAAESAKYAAEYAEFAARREAIFQAGLDYLDEVCPPALEVNQTIIERANRLYELASV
jgi:hypothetical protein